MDYMQCGCGEDIKVLPPNKTIEHRLIRCDKCNQEWMVKPSGRRMYKPKDKKEKVKL